MKPYPRSYSLPPRWRWIFWPVLALSGGGTAVSVWLEDETANAAECLPVAALPAMAALIYWLDHIFFKAGAPDTQDRPGGSAAQGKQK